jgi:hypothetical protein
VCALDGYHKRGSQHEASHAGAGHLHFINYYYYYYYYYYYSIGV